MSARIPAVELVDVGVQTDAVSYSGLQEEAGPSTLSASWPVCSNCEYLYRRLAAALRALTVMEQQIRRMLYSRRPVTMADLAEVADDASETPSRRSAATGELRLRMEAWYIGDSDAPLV